MRTCSDARQDDLQHHPFRDVVLAAQQLRERGFELLGLERGQVTELTGIDPEDRRRVRVHDLHRVQHRAVAADHEHEVEVANERFGIATEMAEPDDVCFRLRQADLDPAVSEPRRCRERERVRDRTSTMRDEPDPPQLAHDAPLTISSKAALSRDVRPRRRVDEELDVPVGAGDGRCAQRDSP